MNCGQPGEDIDPDVGGTCFEDDFLQGCSVDWVSCACGRVRTAQRIV